MLLCPHIGGSVDSSTAGRTFSSPIQLEIETRIGCCRKREQEVSRGAVIAVCGTGGVAHDTHARQEATWILQARQAGLRLLEVAIHASLSL